MKTIAELSLLPRFSLAARRHPLRCLGSGHSAPLLVMMIWLFAGCSMHAPQPATTTVDVGTEAATSIAEQTRDTRPDQSTPETAVRSLSRALDDGRVDLLQQLIDPTDESNLNFLESFKRGIALGATSSMTEMDINVVENSGEVARVQVRGYQVLRIGDKVVSDGRSGDLYTLIKKGDRWYFIGLGQFPPPGWVTTPAPLRP